MTLETAVALRRQRYAKWGGFLGDLAVFDPLVFKISPRDAAAGWTPLEAPVHSYGGVGGLPRMRATAAHANSRGPP